MILETMTYFLKRKQGDLWRINGIYESQSNSKIYYSVIAYVFIVETYRKAVVK